MEEYSILEQLISRILEINRKSEAEKIFPVLVGETGTGKTFFVESYARARNLRVRKILLQSMLEEEILGIPRVFSSKEKNAPAVTRWSLPEFFVDDSEEVVYFLDELDKPRPEVVACILTLLQSREIRGKKVYGAFIGAMQPVDREIFLSTETGKALATRSIFIPFDSSAYFESLKKKTGRDFSWIPAEKVDTPWYKPTPRSIEFFEKLVRTFGLDEISRRIAHYLFGEFAGRVLVEYEKTLSAEDILSEVFKNSSFEDFGKIPAPILVEALGLSLKWLVEKHDPQPFVAVADRLVFDCSADEISAAIEKAKKYIGDGVTVEIDERDAVILAKKLEDLAKKVYEKRKSEMI